MDGQSSCTSIDDHSMICGMKCCTAVLKVYEVISSSDVLIEVEVNVGCPYESGCAWVSRLGRSIQPVDL
jgi:hypothetical protein